MAVVGLDHLVVNTRDVEGSISFYRDVLGMEILRLDEFRKGKVGFVSARVSQEIIIDIRPTKSEDAVTPNMDHFCLVLGPTDMDNLYEELKAKGIHMDGDVHPAWGAQGMGSSSRSGTPKASRSSSGVIHGPHSHPNSIN
jgi:catechol 2,3-dioxygenase-like lactoylglutathione lyase family enzyme